jgi:hypothetical protein
MPFNQGGSNMYFNFNRPRHLAAGITALSLLCLAGTAAAG